MRVGKWQFTPHAWPTLGMVIMTTLFVALAVWQWHRAGEKRVLIAAIHAGERAAPVDVNALARSGKAGGIELYRHVRLRGHYDAAHQVLLESIVHDSRAGYYVLTPFKLQGTDAWVMVNRGWVPSADDGRRPAQPLDVAAGERAISGLWMHLPQPGLRLGSNGAGSGWPRILLYPTMPELAKILHRPLLGNGVWLDATARDGYVRDWHPGPAFGPGRHIGYALQWLALALTVVIVWIALNAHRVRDESV